MDWFLTFVWMNKMKGSFTTFILRQDSYQLALLHRAGEEDVKPVKKVNIKHLVQ